MSAFFNEARRTFTPTSCSRNEHETYAIRNAPMPAVRAIANTDFVEGPRKTVTRRAQDALLFHRRIFAMLVSLWSAHHPQTHVPDH